MARFFTQYRNAGWLQFVKPPVAMRLSAEPSFASQPMTTFVMRRHPLTFMFRNTRQAPPARRMRLQRSSAAGRVSAPIRT